MTEQGPQQEKPNSLEGIKGKISNVSSEKRWAMSCYIPVVNLFTCVLTSVKMVNSKLCRFHARQGLVVFAVWLVATILGVVASTLSLMLLGIFLVLCVAGMVIAYEGKETSLPVLGQLAVKIPEYYIFKFLTGKIPEEEAANADNAATKEQAKSDSEKKEDGKVDGKKADYSAKIVEEVKDNSDKK